MHFAYERDNSREVHGSAVLQLYYHGLREIRSGSNVDGSLLVKSAEFALCLDEMDRSEPLIPVGGTSRESRGPDRFSTILLPSVVASLAALNFGFTLGYTSPTQEKLIKDLKLNQNKFSWFGVSQESKN